MRSPARRVWQFLFVAVPILGVVGYFIGTHLWSREQYRAALGARARHDYQHAGGLLATYLRTHPDDAGAWLLAARTARQQGDKEAAGRLLREADQRGAEAAQIALERRLAAVQSGDLRDAADLLAACGAAPDKSETPLILQALAEGGLRAQADVLVRRAADLWLRLLPGRDDQVLGLLWRGQAEKIANDTERSNADFRLALDLNPDHRLARILLAANLVADAPDEARPHLEILRTRFPDDPEVRFQLARYHRTMGELTDAARLLDGILEATPNQVAASVERGRVALDLGRPEEAERFLRRAVASAPGQRSANANLADCLRQLGRTAEADVYLKRSADIAARQIGSRPGSPGQAQPAGGGANDNPRRK